MNVVEIKKSKFIGYAFNVSSIKEIEFYLNNIKREHKKATHVCYAYKFFSDKLYVKCFDDNEPSGTAGKPILNVVDKNKFSNILVVVVRYFGGILLGAGGLIRAYSKTASNTVKEFKQLN